MFKNFEIFRIFHDFKDSLGLLKRSETNFDLVIRIFNDY